MKSASIDDIARVKREIEADRETLRIFSLFGTSGIRGKTADISLSAVKAYEDKTIMSPKLAYLYGRAYGQVMKEDKMELKVWVGMDPRPSSMNMAQGLMEGLIDEGIDAFFNGVAITPTSSLYHSSIIITGSHNLIEWNGIKGFMHGVPISFDMEWRIEKGFRAMEKLKNEGIMIPLSKDRGVLIDNSDEVYTRYLERARREEQPNLAGAIIPLDLAFGSAGSTLQRISPQIKVLLKTGACIVGYGTEIDGEKTNYRIGAGYPYGETPFKMTEGELTAFAQAKYGYGDGLKRSYYFPKDYRFKERSLTEDAITFCDGERAFFNVEEDTGLLKGLLNEIEGKELLPACSVDCDCDRILTTSVSLSHKAVPYLSGDMMMLLFALNLPNEIKKVVFTVESGMSIAKLLEKKGIEYEEVTVGDRAIADYIMESSQDKIAGGEPSGQERLERNERYKIAGGEPSGHIMFTAEEKGKLILIDDPIITYLKLLGIMKNVGKDFDSLVAEITSETEEVFTARRPEAWAGEPYGSGISLREKVDLELREAGQERLVLTPYAKGFIKRYIEIFAKGYIEAYYKNIEENKKEYPQIKSSFSLQLKEGYDIKGCVDRIPISVIQLSSAGALIEEIEVKLRATNKSWAGPADINLSFYAKDREGKSQLAGGVISRSSGTSPKNSAYNKLWFEHYPTGRKIGNKEIEEVTTKMAVKRVEFTDTYVKEVLRQ